MGVASFKNIFNSRNRSLLIGCYQSECHGIGSFVPFYYHIIKAAVENHLRSSMTTFFILVRAKLSASVNWAPFTWAPLKVLIVEPMRFSPTL